MTANPPTSPNPRRERAACLVYSLVVRSCLLSGRVNEKSGMVNASVVLNMPPAERPLPTWRFTSFTESPTLRPSDPSALLAEVNMDWPPALWQKINQNTNTDTTIFERNCIFDWGSCWDRQIHTPRIQIDSTDNVFYTEINVIVYWSKVVDDGRDGTDGATFQEMIISNRIEKYSGFRKTEKISGLFKGRKLVQIVQSRSTSLDFLPTGALNGIVVIIINSWPYFLTGSNCTRFFFH